MNISSLIFILFFSCSAFGFSSHSEYHSIDRNEPFRFDNPSEIDGEYESDVLTYSLSFDERWLYLSSPRAFTGTFGSLDGKHFFARQAFKADFSIAPHTQFKVINFRERDFEIEAQDTIFEIQHYVHGRSHGLALFGSASFEKKEDDVGLAYLWRNQTAEADRHFRLYAAAPDFSRNQRNTADDRFRKKPIAAGALYQEHKKNGSFKELSARYEPELKWEFPSEEKMYRYSRTYLYAAQKNVVTNSAYNWRIEYDNKSEEQNPTTLTSTVTPEDWNTQRLRLQLEHYYRPLESQPIRYGLWLSRSQFEKDAQKQKISFAQPYIWYEHKKHPKHFWQSGLSLISADRDGLIAGTRAAPSRLDSRLNFALNSLFRENLVFKALFTFDLESLNDSDRWEGGNIQLTSTF